MPPPNPVAYQALDLNDAITEHLPLVKRIAYQIASRLPPNVELDDLVQEGLTGLLDALKRYESMRAPVFGVRSMMRVGAMTSCRATNVMGLLI
jgi:RNA polymerase sigma factor for flagellar operon FliA